jgi:ribosome biogenesis protein MAK21
MERGEYEVAASLVRTYLGLFERAVAAGELQSRLLAALLTGVARAQPYLKPRSLGGGGGAGAGAETGALAEHVDTIFKLVHVGNFAASTQARSILFHFVSEVSASSRPKQSTRNKLDNPREPTSTGAR